MWAYLLMIGIAGMTIQTVGKSIKYERMEKNQKNKELEDWMEWQFFKKVEENQLPIKLISRPGWRYQIYEVRYLGYRLLIEERKNKIAYWLEKKHTFLYAIKGEENNEKWSWEMQVPQKSIKRALYGHHAEKLKKVAESGEWKKNVVKAVGEHYPKLKKALKIAKKTDEDVYVKLKSFVPQYIHLYLHKDKMEEHEAKKWFEIIPEQIENVIKEYNDLHPTYRIKGKEEFLKTLDGILKKYPTIQKERDCVFLTLKE